MIGYILDENHAEKSVLLFISDRQLAQLKRRRSLKGKLFGYSNEKVCDLTISIDDSSVRRGRVCKEIRLVRYGKSSFEYTVSSRFPEILENNCSTPDFPYARGETIRMINVNKHNDMGDMTLFEKLTGKIR